MKTWTIAVALVALCCVALANEEESQRRRVLVIIDNQALLSTHSQFLQDLTAQGFEVNVELANGNYKLKEYGEYKYDQLILLCTSEADPRSLKQHQILDFFDSGRNVFIAADVDISRMFRLTINDFGVEVDDVESKVFDHAHAASKIDHSLFKATNIQPFPGIDTKVGDGILFRGVGLTLTKYENFQVFGLLRGNDFTYSLKQSQRTGKTVLNQGQEVVLIAAVQGRNNARVVISGSLDLLSNELYELSKGANRKFVQQVINWNFGLAGFIRATGVHHSLQGHTEQPGEYKVLDDIHYQIDIEEWNNAAQKWVPYKATDLQLEFQMLDPYIRMPLTQKDNTATYVADFKAPDKYGVFQFKLIYHKPGYSFLDVRTKVTVRPFKHNEYERYLPEASPYYFGVFTTIAGFFIFAIFFLFDKEK